MLNLQQLLQNWNPLALADHTYVRANQVAIHCQISRDLIAKNTHHLFQILQNGSTIPVRRCQNSVLSARQRLLLYLPTI